MCQCEEYVARLEETELLTDILVPIFHKRESGNAMFYHGPWEYGKDILYWDATRKQYGAVVAKAERVHGDTEKGGGHHVGTVLRQIEEAFESPELAEPLKPPVEIIVALSKGITDKAKMRFENWVEDQPAHRRQVSLWTVEDICREYSRLYGEFDKGKFDRLRRLREDVRAKTPREQNRQPTLDKLRTKFVKQGLVIAIGDRRQRPARWPHDVLAAAASPADLQGILSLGLGNKVEIWTDTALLENLGQSGENAVLSRNHVLSIGFGQVNLVSRQLIKRAPFRCLYKEGAEEEMAALEARAKLLWGKDMSPEDRVDQMGGEEELSRVIAGMRATELIDLVTGLVYPPVEDGCDQHGLVAVCESPFSPSHYAILAGGVHMFGTWAAIRALAGQIKDDGLKSSWAENYPMGGIVRHTSPIGILSFWDTRSSTRAVGPPYEMRAFRSVFPGEK